MKWHRLAEKVFPVGDTAAPYWQRMWGFAMLACFACTFLRGQMPPWWEPTEYVPAGIFANLMLICLAVTRPLLSQMAWWRLSVFPITGIWLPYLLQVGLSRPSTAIYNWMKAIVGWSVIPPIADPWAWGRGFANTMVCLGFTIAVLVTVGFIQRSQAVRD